MHEIVSQCSRLHAFRCWRRTIFMAKGDSDERLNGASGVERGVIEGRPDQATMTGDPC